MARSAHLITEVHMFESSALVVALSRFNLNLLALYSKIK